MKPLHAVYLLAILATATFAIVFQSRNDGFDVGYPSGYNQAILDGRMIIDCKFQTNCQKDYERGYLQGLIECQPKSCKPQRGP